MRDTIHHGCMLLPPSGCPAGTLRQRTWQAPSISMSLQAPLADNMHILLQGMAPQKDLQKQLSEARRNDNRTPGATPLGVTPAATPMGSPRSAAGAPGSPFGR